MRLMLVAECHCSLHIINSDKMSFGDKQDYFVKSIMMKSSMVGCISETVFDEINFVERLSMPILRAQVNPNLVERKNTER